MTFRPNRKHLHLVGSGLGVIGVIFVAIKLLQYRDQLSFSTLSASTWLAISLLTIGYGFCGALLALAWRELLAFHKLDVTPQWSVRVYGMSQLAKYIPGNIFHLASRQAIGVAAGMPAWPFAKSIGWELGIISASALLFIPLAMPLKIPTSGAAVAGLAFLALVAAAVLLLKTRLSARLAKAVAYYVTFLLLTGLTFAALLNLTSTIEVGTTSHLGLWISLSGAYVLAWLVGLVTPGAPAGVGVREAILYLLLNRLTSHAELITAIVLGRGVSVAGDFLFFVAATFIRPSSR